MDSFFVHQAATSGDGAALRRSLANGACPDDLNEDGLTALMLAVAARSEACVRDLLRAGANVHLRTPLGKTCLMMARCVSIGEQLLQAGAEVNVESTDQGTPLLDACASNAEAAWIAMLLDAGADATAIQPDGTSVLLNAAGNASAETIAALLSKGANPNVKHTTGTTPLIRALKNSDEAVRALLQGGAQAHAIDILGCSALTHAFDHGTVGMVRLLVEYGFNVNAACPREGSTPLMHALPHCGSHLAEKIRVLLDAGARADAVDAYGCSVLHWLARGAMPSDAAVGGYSDIQTSQMQAVRMLVEAGTDVNHNDTRFMGPVLNLACGKGAEHLVEALLTVGADFDAFDGWGKTPLMSATQAGHIGICRRLLAAGSAIDRKNVNGCTALKLAASLPERLPTLTALLDAGAEIDARDSHGFTAAMSAAMAGQSEALGLLMTRGANVVGQHHKGVSILHQAIVRGCSVGTINSLIEGGAELNVPEAIESHSPLQAALIRNDATLVGMLLGAGARLSYLGDSLDPKLLRQAVESGNLDVIGELLQAGACVNDIASGADDITIAATGSKNTQAIVEGLMDWGSDINLIGPANSKSRFSNKPTVLAFVRSYLVKWHSRRSLQLEARWHRRWHAIHAWQYLHAATDDSVSSPSLPE